MSRKRKQIYDPKPYLTITEDATGYLFTTRNESPTKAAREAIRLLNQSIDAKSTSCDVSTESDEKNGTENCSGNDCDNPDENGCNQDEDDDIEKMIAKEKSEFDEEKQRHSKRARHIKTIKNHAFIHCLVEELQPAFSLRLFLNDFSEKDVKFLGRCYPVFATCRVSEVDKGLSMFEQRLKIFFKDDIEKICNLNFKWMLEHEVKNSDFCKFDSLKVPVKQLLWKLFPESESVFDRPDHIIKLVILKQYCYFCFLFDFSKHNKYVFATVGK
ncbi:uncharacterized protein LOC142335150 [Convolutriloba macropyga]|uniref:uncharacterized protein LOC142335150 n=1 Tax=Convolutriloba macropyga TaxID=536237 RepID=UPI003F520527